MRKKKSTLIFNLKVTIKNRQLPFLATWEQPAKQFSLSWQKHFRFLWLTLTLKIPHCDDQVCIYHLGDSGCSRDIHSCLSHLDEWLRMFGADEETGVPGLALSETNISEKIIERNWMTEAHTCLYSIPKTVRDVIYKLIKK